MESGSANDSSEDLNEKHLILRKEGLFSAMKPVEPRSKFIMIFQVFMLLGIGYFYYIASKDNPNDLDKLRTYPFLLSTQFTLLLISVGNQLSYKREHRLYSEACEIIEFYKNESAKHGNFKD